MRRDYKRLISNKQKHISFSISSDKQTKASPGLHQKNNNHSFCLRHSPVFSPWTRVLGINFTESVCIVLLDLPFGQPYPPTRELQTESSIPARYIHLGSTCWPLRCRPIGAQRTVPRSEVGVQSTPLHWLDRSVTSGAREGRRGRSQWPAFVTDNVNAR